MDKPASPEYPIEPLLAQRWSPRCLDPERAVPRELLASLLAAAAWAPSSYNEQPWRYLVFDGEDPEALQRARDCLVEGNAWARKAPVLLLSVARQTFTHNGQPNPVALHDVGAASVQLHLEAQARGLGVHQMAGFDADRARESFGIPDGYTPVAMIAVGWPGRVDALPEALQEVERSARTRRPVAESAFAGRWERPWRGP